MKIIYLKADELFEPAPLRITNNQDTKTRKIIKHQKPNGRDGFWLRQNPSLPSLQACEAV
ncbi:MAG: hypothetical protein ABIG87_02460 [Patescibacteria group bacterium]